ncbi:hypothetical protein QTO34_017059 [Cnephaeus nilssonii]|uniref:D-isomer specific 2-hydroxyacid dehydrogenase catalytic domain-containing protein n=1 Tax=Cnephaeus nilssonii TaxID=3371016 RepID=A0AA40I0D9_CNENI|nr:hypothetical protein QTO34_017059 [Eptesicus nilssonii]
MLIDCHTLKDGGTHSHKIAEPRPLSPPATQGQAEAQESLEWQLPCHPGPPESQHTLRYRPQSRNAPAPWGAVEVPTLKDLATVALCDHQSPHETHWKVQNEAVGAMILTSPSPGRTGEVQALRVTVRTGSGYDHVDTKAASPRGVAPCSTQSAAAEQTASALRHVLNAPEGHVAVPGAAGRHAGAERGADPGIRGDTGASSASVARGRRSRSSQAFGFSVICCDPYLQDRIERSLGAQRPTPSRTCCIRATACPCTATSRSTTTTSSATSPSSR